MHGSNGRTHVYMLALDQAAANILGACDEGGKRSGQIVAFKNISNDLCERDRAERCRLRGLPDGGVAGCERQCQVPARDN